MDEKTSEYKEAGETVDEAVTNGIQQELRAKSTSASVHGVTQTSEIGNNHLRTGGDGVGRRCGFGRGAAYRARLQARADAEARTGGLQSFDAGGQDSQTNSVSSAEAPKSEESKNNKKKKSAWPSMAEFFATPSPPRAAINTGVIPKPANYKKPAEALKPKPVKPKPAYERPRMAAGGGSSYSLPSPAIVAEEKKAAEARKAREDEEQRRAKEMMDEQRRRVEQEEARVRAKTLASLRLHKEKRNKLKSEQGKQWLLRNAGAVERPPTENRWGEDGRLIVTEQFSQWVHRDVFEEAWGHIRLENARNLARARKPPMFDEATQVDESYLRDEDDPKPEAVKKENWHQGECSLCRAEARGAVLRPCGHCDWCVDCARHIAATQGRCPICHEEIESFTKLHFC